MDEVWLSQNNYMNSTCTKFTIRAAFTLFHISLENFKNYSYFNKSRNNLYSINKYIILQRLHLLSIFFTYLKKLFVFIQLLKKIPIMVPPFQSNLSVNDEFIGIMTFQNCLGTLYLAVCM